MLIHFCWDGDVVVELVEATGIKELGAVLCLF